ncbi:MAG: hypothetical protein FWE42_08055 [Defluviitaleaceae bacterium]|nr:hypothetical protein [Defluviitaleaceae bacterium]
MSIVGDVVSSVAQAYGKQLIEIIKEKGLPNITLPVDENGNAYIDKEKHPDLYDWAING